MSAAHGASIESIRTRQGSSITAPGAADAAWMVSTAQQSHATGLCTRSARVVRRSACNQKGRRVGGLPLGRSCPELVTLSPSSHACCYTDVLAALMAWPPDWLPPMDRMNAAPRAARGLPPMGAENWLPREARRVRRAGLFPRSLWDAAPMRTVLHARVMRHTDDAGAGRRDCMGAPTCQPTRTMPERGDTNPRMPPPASRRERDSGARHSADAAAESAGW